MYLRRMNDLNVFHRTRPNLAVLVVLVLGFGTLAANEPVGAQPWTQWRGPSRDGSFGGVDWPETLRGLDRVWRVELGQGYPGPIVFGDRVFVLESVDNSTEAAVALDRATGAEIWRTSWQASGKVPFFAKSHGEWIRSTPAHDGEALYVGGMEEVVRKLDAHTGEVIWSVDFPSRFGTSVPDFGFASSPLLVDDALVIQAANSVVKLDAGTGETQWRALQASPDMMSSGAFSSPVVATLSGRRQLLVQTRHALHGIDLESGEELWSQEVPNFRGMNILTPVVYGDSVLTSSYKNRTYLYDVAAEEADFAPAERWSNKVQGYMSTPVVIDGHAYLHLGNGRLACIDLATGVERWISKPFGDYWSIVTQGDKLLALDASGELHLIRADPEGLDLLGSKEIATQPTWGHLAVSGDELFVRELGAVALYRWRTEPTEVEVSP